MIAHIFLSPFTHESRCLKEARSALASGLVQKVCFVGLGKDLPAHESPLPGLEIIRLPLRSRNLKLGPLSALLKYLEWSWRVLAWLRSRQGELKLVQCHSLASLPLSVAARWLLGCPMLYDAHELETETHHLGGMRQRFAKWLEWSLIGQADGVLVVGNAIAEWYANAYGIPRPTVVRNVPEIPAASSGTVPKVMLREALGLSQDTLLCLYQGGLMQGRGIEALLATAPKLSNHLALVFMGYGPLEDRIREACQGSHQLHWVPAVPPHELLAITAQADLGLCWIEPICLSYRYSLPNKLFEYLLAEVPVLINEASIEQLALVQEQGCGWAVGEGEEALANCLNTITPEALAEAQDKVRAAKIALSWANEAEHLLATYAKLLPSEGSRQP